VNFFSRSWSFFSNASILFLSGLWPGLTVRGLTGDQCRWEGDVRFEEEESVGDVRGGRGVDILS
jgi:hypothetical protein